MVRNHTVKQQISLPLSQNINLPVLVPVNDNRNIGQMLPDKCPGGFPAPCLAYEIFPEAVLWFIDGNDQILLNRGRRGDLFETAPLLIQSPDVGDYKSRLLQRLLDCIPDRVFGIMKFDCHPPVRFQYTVVFGKASCHQLLIFRQSLSHGRIDNRLKPIVCGHPDPGFPEKTQLRIIQICAKGRICKNIITGIVRNRQLRRRSGGNAGLIPLIVFQRQTKLFDFSFIRLERIRLTDHRGNIKRSA